MHTHHRYHLYFLFDLMPGGDLMDVLVAEASVIRHRVPQGGLRVGCLAPKVKMLQVSTICVHCLCTFFYFAFLCGLSSPQARCSGIGTLTHVFVLASYMLSHPNT